MYTFAKSEQCRRFEKCSLTYQTSAMVYSKSVCLHFQRWNYSDELQIYFGLEYPYFLSPDCLDWFVVSTFSKHGLGLSDAAVPVKIPHFQSLGTCKLKGYCDCSHFLFLLMFIYYTDLWLTQAIDSSNTTLHGLSNFLYSQNDSTVICRHTLVIIYSIKYTFFRNIWKKICRFKYFSMSCTH